MVEAHEINGQPGAILRDRDGKVLSTFVLDIADGQIQTVRTVINPDKLGHVGEVADAWAALREAQRARRGIGLVGHDGVSIRNGGESTRDNGA
jgi:RNA polymerase sigma-70 factor (ECF subfamily)